MKTAGLLTSLIPFSLLAAPPPESWVNGASGNWNTAANWSNAFVPNAQDQVVTISDLASIASVATITQDVNPTATVGSMTLEDPNGHGYIIAGTNSVTLNVSSGVATISQTNSPANTASNTISAPIVLASNLNITQLTPAKNLTISGGISGSPSVTYVGSQLFILSGTNSFTGGLIIQGGTFQCGQASTLPPTGAVTMSGGILDLNNNAQTIGGLTGAFPITLGNATLTINTTAANSYSGSISGGGNLTVGGTGSLALTSSSGYLGGTTVKAGTLQLGVNNALPINGAVNLTGGTLDLNNFNQAVGNLSATAGTITLGTGQLSISLGASEVFTGVISGSGPVVFNGNGFIWTLGAAQTYTSLTTINSGTIQLGIANGFPANAPVTLAGSGSLDLNNFSQTVGTLTASLGTLVHLGSGQLTVAPTASVNFAGVINGTGSVVFQGPFTWTMQAHQTYTGGTTITGGIFQMGVADGLAHTGAVTITNPGILLLSNNSLEIASLAGNGSVDLGSGTLTLDTTNTTGPTTFSGSIGGVGGQLVVDGNGTLILAGTNTYSGGTTVGGTATLQGDTNSLQGMILNNSVLYFNQAFSGTYAGPLSGSGLLQVGGGGIVILTATPVQDSAIVLSGELDIGAASTLTATTVTVNSGATLGGSGTFVANILNSGTINPGSINLEDTLTVNGNVTFQSGSSFIANLTPTTSDRLVVNGVVTISSGSQIIVDAERGEYEEDTRYALITSTQPVVGQFQIVHQTNPFLETEIIYNQLLPGSVEVDLSIKSLSDVIVGGNAGAIATCITQAHMKSDHDLEQLVSDIIFFSVDQVRKILEQMQPSQLRALTTAEQTNTLFVQQTLNWRMAEFDRSICEREATNMFPWNFWVSLAGNWTDQRPADHNVGYNAPAAGLTLGFDGKVSDNLYFGLALEYGHVALDWKENQGFSIINRMSVGPYLSYIGRFGYVNASLLTSFANFDTNRQIPFFGRTATSNHNGETFLPHLDAGLVFHPAPSVSLTPFAMVDLLFGWEDSYQEAGAESLNFSIASSSSQMLRSELGLKISKCAVRSHTKWVHDLKASWVREERFNGKDLLATFRQFPCSFKVEGLFPSRNLLDLGMGLTFIFKKDRFSATLRYEGQFGEGITLQSGIAQLLTRF
ncbi:MAG: autotransporter domain-containing protein [Rhabdochlamydiaceae bacterium]